jgi:hypothetical protein
VHIPKGSAERLDKSPVLEYIPGHFVVLVFLVSRPLIQLSFPLKDS